MARIQEYVTVTTKHAGSLVTTAEAASRTGLAEITLRVWRWKNNPHQPPYVRVGVRGVRYDVAALDEWLAARTHKPGRKKRSTRR